MTNKPTEEELVLTAAQLRKPQGQVGLEIGEFMNKGNLVMNLHSIAALNPKPNESILEIGMGNGAFVKNILGVDPSIRYTGLDYSQLMVDESIKNNRSFVDAGRAVFQCGDIARIPFNDDSFDAIFTVNTFYFWEDHQAVISELKRVLKPQGHLLIAIRPYHVMVDIPVTQFNFGLMEEEQVIALFREAGFTSLNVTNVIEPEAEHWGKNYRLETLLLDFSMQE